MFSERLRADVKPAVIQRSDQTPDQPIDIPGVFRGSPVSFERDGRPCWLYADRRAMCLADAIQHCPADLTAKVWQVAIREYARAAGEYRWLRDLVDRPMAYSSSRAGFLNEFERYVVVHHADIERVAREMLVDHPDWAAEVLKK